MPLTVTQAPRFVWLRANLKMWSRHQIPPVIQAAILIQLFMSWGPILMLIGVWLWLIKRSNASNYQNRLIDLMKEQNQTLERQAAAIEKIAQMQETQNLRN